MSADHLVGVAGEGRRGSERRVVAVARVVQVLPEVEGRRHQALQLALPETVHAPTDGVVQVGLGPDLAVQPVARDADQDLPDILGRVLVDLARTTGTAARTASCRAAARRPGS